MRRSGTLSAQLAGRVTIIVALVTLALSVTSILATRSVLMGQLDQALDQALTRQGDARGGHDEDDDDDDLDDDDRAPGVALPGMSVGTVIVSQLDNGRTLIGEVADGKLARPDEAVVAALLTTPPDGEKHTITVTPGHSYRVKVRSDASGRVIVALPTHEVDEVVQRLVLIAAALGIVAVLVAALATRAVATSVTRPLRRLSATATDVAERDLTAGDAVVGVRVPDSQLPGTHEVARLTQAFNHMLHNVDGALAARQASETKLRRFVADASHELRNPLAAIRGYTELAGRSPTHEDRAFAMQRIDSESARMAKLVNDLLLLARLDADPEPQLSDVDAVEVVLNAVSDARAVDATHRWQLRLPPDSITVRADAGQLHQVVVNLLSNARAHTPPGTTVTASVEAIGAEVCIRVCDDGPGIPPELLPHVFERFARADHSRAHRSIPSTGLGLAIVQAVVTSFYGRVEASSVPGNTCFLVRLPAAAGPPGQG
ncbi:MAG: sensor histidine kinase [Arachnia sp.]